MAASGTVPGTTARPRPRRATAPPAALVVSTTGVIAFAVLTTVVGAAHGAPPEFLILDAVIGAVYLGAGVIAWLRRPEVLTGPLLVACSVANFVGSYGPTGHPTLSHVGFAFQGYYDLALAVLVLALPRRWPAGVARLASIALLGAFLARSASRLLLVDPAALGCPDCPPNPFAIISDPAAFLAVESASNAVIAALTLGVALDCVRRLFDSRPVVRHVMWPILVAGVVSMSVAAFDAAEYAITTATGLPIFEVPEAWQPAFEWSLFLLRLAVPIGFVLGTLRLRRSAGPLVALAVGLGRVPSPVRMEAALAAALGDSNIRLLRPDRDGTGWISADGGMAAAPVDDATHAVTLLEHDGRALAAIVHDPVLREDPALVGSVMAVLRLAVENERLDSALQAQLEAVRASRARLVVATEEERRRIERDLHDGAQQRLVGVTIAIQQARQAANETAAAPEVHTRLTTAADELQAAIHDLRELARGIHPALLEDEGLPSAVAALTRRAGLPVETRVDLARRLPRHIETTAYFTIAEALTNATRHAHASTASVSVHDAGDRLEVVVVDNGVGGADPTRGSGLSGLADRIASVDGRLAIESPPGGGTRLRVEVPIP